MKTSFSGNSKYQTRTVTQKVGGKTDVISVVAVVQTSDAANEEKDVIATEETKDDGDGLTRKRSVPTAIGATKVAAKTTKKQKKTKKRGVN
jgi:hypothetical protein